jgi:hypothetical protein
MNRDKCLIETSLFVNAIVVGYVIMSEQLSVFARGIQLESSIVIGLLLSESYVDSIIAVVGGLSFVPFGDKLFDGLRLLTYFLCTYETQIIYTS